MPLNIVNGDLLSLDVDIIVNAANSQLQMGLGVCGKIFEKAGAKKLQKACDDIGGCKTGKACYTSGYQLCKYIIHAVGPIYRDGNYGEERLLASAYVNALKIADDLKATSIGFPLISSGIYGYPKVEAFDVAVKTIGKYLRETESELNVTLVIYDKPEDYKTITLYKEWEHRSEYAAHVLNGLHKQYAIGFTTLSEAKRKDTIDEIMANKGQDFMTTLYSIMDLKGLTDIQVYKNANYDRRQFSQMRSNPNYHPTKQTALAYAIATKCNLEECNRLLETAGYCLSNSNETDLVVRYCIEKGIYDINIVNSHLFTYKQKLLGSNVAY